MEEIRLNTSELLEKAETLRAGQRILLSGVAYTSRDAAHKRICALLDEGKEPPYPLKGAAIYYAGPTLRRRGLQSAPAGRPPAAEWIPILQGFWILASNA